MDPRAREALHQQLRHAIEQEAAADRLRCAGLWGAIGGGIALGLAILILKSSNLLAIAKRGQEIFACMGGGC